MMKNNSVKEVAGNEGWRGNTIDELRMRRAMALVRLEVGKGKLNTSLASMKTRASDKGWRAMLTSDTGLQKLKATDYIFVGFKASKALFTWWAKRKMKKAAK